VREERTKEDPVWRSLDLEVSALQNNQEEKQFQNHQLSTWEKNET
jgi:hypothetical protein